jgi:muramoyltetrapeptide carboxypeptidase
MSRFHLIAPSGYCINQQAAALGVQRLELQGHQVDNRGVITRRDQRFAGQESERLNDLNALVALEGADIIVLPVRGGYGASRLLEDIDWQGLIRRQQSQPLLICGHSDFTVVQMGLLARGGVITFSGPMLAGNFGAPTLNEFTERHFWQALRQPELTVEWRGEGPRCHTQGTLWGGNLAMLVSLIGTPWLPAIEEVFWWLRISMSILSAWNVCCCSCCIAAFSRVRRRSYWAVSPAPIPMNTMQATILIRWWNTCEAGSRSR